MPEGPPEGYQSAWPHRTMLNQVKKLLPDHWLTLGQQFVEARAVAIAPTPALGKEIPQTTGWSLQRA